MVDPTTAEPKAKALLSGVEKRLGMTPNAMRVLAVNPMVLGAYLNFSGALSAGRLGKKVYEQIALTVAEASGCDYCLAAHAMIGKRVGLAAMDVLAARVGTASNERTMAALTFARKLVAHLGRVPPDDIEEARATLDDAEIVEIIAMVAVNLFTNYLNLAADTEIDFPPVAKLAGAA
jgi:uncharacterized peroxidase-related enzyme